MHDSSTSNIQNDEQASLIETAHGPKQTNVLFFEIVMKVSFFCIQIGTLVLTTLLSLSSVSSMNLFAFHVLLMSVFFILCFLSVYVCTLVFQI